MLFHCWSKVRSAFCSCQLRQQALLGCSIGPIKAAVKRFFSLDDRLPDGKDLIRCRSGNAGSTEYVRACCARAVRHERVYGSTDAEQRELLGRFDLRFQRQFGSRELVLILLQRVAPNREGGTESANRRWLQPTTAIVGSSQPGLGYSEFFP